MKVRDYLRSHEAHLWVEGSDTRVRVNGLDIVIRSLPSEEIRTLLNEAVAHMVVRLNKNLTGSKVKFEQRVLELLSISACLISGGGLRRIMLLDRVILTGDSAGFGREGPSILARVSAEPTSTGSCDFCFQLSISGVVGRCGSCSVVLRPIFRRARSEGRRE